MMDFFKIMDMSDKFYIVKNRHIHPPVAKNTICYMLYAVYYKIIDRGKELC